MVLKHSFNQLQKLLKLQHNTITKERQSFWDRKSYLKKQRKQKKPLQLPKDFEDISER